MRPNRIAQRPGVPIVPLAALVQESGGIVWEMKMKGVHAVAVDQGVVGPKGQGTVVTGQGLFDLSRLIERHRQVVVSIHIIGP